MACSVDLTVPAGARLSCTKDAECPAGLRCDLMLGRCVEPGTTAPLVVLQSVGGAVRPFADVPVALSATNPSGGTLHFSLEVATNCDGSGTLSDWRPGTLSAGAEATEMGPDGARTLTWNVRADAETGGSEFVPVSVDTDSDDVPDLDGVSDCGQVRVRMQAEDDLGQPTTLSPPWMPPPSLARSGVRVFSQLCRANPETLRHNAIDS
ncbi:MAG: hypothetical protein A2341_08305 [Deltaproteobacteria bacterium RIFOXYB12_FULL_58_9]|nr:MAG: hypothetical protein A2341_08305 [Deltaproteobacteria bacterium RIFOXYB12_FULL_58_9]